MEVPVKQQDGSITRIIYADITVGEENKLYSIVLTKHVNGEEECSCGNAFADNDIEDAVFFKMKSLYPEDLKYCH
jgi:hypothetical protein